MTGGPGHARVGIDIGGTSMKLAAVADGRAAICLAGDPYTRPTRQALADELRKCWRELLRQAGEWGGGQAGMPRRTSSGTRRPHRDLTGVNTGKPLITGQVLTPFRGQIPK